MHTPITPLTRQQLDDLPAGAVVVDAEGTAWQVDHQHQWRTPGYNEPIDSQSLAEYEQAAIIVWIPPVA